jgi:hypothetical protein
MPLIMIYGAKTTGTSENIMWLIIKMIKNTTDNAAPFTATPPEDLMP